MEKLEDTEINMRQEFRVIIAGGRDFAVNPAEREDNNLLYSTMDNLLRNKIRSHRIVIICGMAKGADLAGARYAKDRNFHIRYFPAEWDKHGKKAGVLRNDEMAQNADALVAFWDGQSSGTKNMIETAKKHGLQVRVIHYSQKSEEQDKDEFGFPIY